WVIREQEGVCIHRRRQVISAVGVSLFCLVARPANLPFLREALLTLLGTVLFMLFGIEEGELSQGKEAIVQHQGIRKGLHPRMESRERSCRIFLELREEVIANQHL